MNFQFGFLPTPRIAETKSFFCLENHPPLLGVTALAPLTVSASEAASMLASAWSAPPTTLRVPCRLSETWGLFFLKTICFILRFFIKQKQNPPNQINPCLPLSLLVIPPYLLYIGGLLGNLHSIIRSHPGRRRWFRPLKNPRLSKTCRSSLLQNRASLPPPLPWSILPSQSIQNLFYFIYQQL